MSAPKLKDPGWLNLPLFPPPITWQAPDLTSLPSWRGAKRVCLDVECRDDDLFELGPGVRRGGYVCGIAFAIEDGPSHYLPIRHEGGGNLPEEHVWQYLRDNAALLEHDVVFNSAPYDLDYLWENKVEFPKVKFYRDVQNAGPILDELQRTYNLDAMCGRYGITGKDEGELRRHATEWGLDPKTGMWRLHAGAVGAYGEGDVRAPLRLLRVMEKEIAAQDLQETFDLESKALPALVRMTRRGIRVDLDELAQVEAWAKERLQSYIDQIHHLTGVTIGSISNGEEVAVALRKRGLQVPTKIHGGTDKRMSSVTKLWLQQQTDEVAKAVVSGREFAKLLSTYVGGFRKHLVGEHGDRLHPSFKQLRGATDEDESEDDEGGARFGRCASKHPNIQAQPKRSKEILTRWRKVLVPDKNKRWFKADLGQQEPRITVHFAELCNLPGARQAGNAFRDDPCFDPYQLMVELCKTSADTDLKKLRDDLKEVYLGKCYGMGGGKLAKKLKLPTEWRTSREGKEYEAAGPEAQAIIDRFDRGVPYVKALARLCTRVAKEKGYIVAFGKRRVRFELDVNGEIRDEHKALNKLIQGCLPASTRVLTRAGLHPIGSVKRGEVWTGTSWQRFSRLERGPCELAEIKLEDGKILRCDTRHQVLIDTGDGYSFKSFKDLERGDLVCESMATALEFGMSELQPIDFYWMGFAIGNGSTRATGHPHALTLSISNRKGRYAEDQKVKEALDYYRGLGLSPRDPRRGFYKKLRRPVRAVTITTENKKLHALYTAWGYPWGAEAHDKRVPTSVWSASLAGRRSFLTGLLDADGTVGNSQTYENTAPCLHLCQRPLLEEVQILLRTVGVESSLHHFPSEEWAYRLDLNGGMAAASLGYGRARVVKVHKAKAPKHVIATFLRQLRRAKALTASQQTLISRLRHGGTTSVYTLRDLCVATQTPPPIMYVGRRLIEKRSLGVVEPTFTLSVEHPSHRFDSESVISKNSAAHQTKKALVELDRAGFPLQLTVHDEFGYSGDSEEEARRMGEITCDAVVIRVPFRCDIEAGPSYGELKKLFTVSSKQTLLSMENA